MSNQVGLLEEAYLTEEGLNTPITRVEMTVILGYFNRRFHRDRANEFTTSYPINSSITDFGNLSSFDKRDISYCVNYELMDVINGRFRPHEGVTEEQARIFINNALTK